MVEHAAFCEVPHARVHVGSDKAVTNEVLALPQVRVVIETAAAMRSLPISAGDPSATMFAKLLSSRESDYAVMTVSS